MEAIPHEQGQISRMIKVRMGQQHFIDAAGRNGKLRPIAQTELLEALKQPAIDEDIPVASGEQIF